MSEWKRCQFCRGGKKKAVAQCTVEIRAYVCDEHYVPAGGNGFYPKRFDVAGFSMRLDPDRAAIIAAQRSARL